MGSDLGGWAEVFVKGKLQSTLPLWEATNFQ